MSENNENNKSKRNKILTLLALFFLGSGIVYTIYYYSYSQYFEYTDNAYVGQNIVYITPQTSGTVKNVFVSEMQYVKAGTILGKLDTRDKELAFEKAKIALAQSVRQIKQLQSQKDQELHNIKLAQVHLNKTFDDIKRNQGLAKTHTISDEKYQNILYENQAAKEELVIAQKRYNALKDILKEDDISKNPVVQSEIIQLQQDYLELKRCDIVAPISGVIAKKNFNIGENIDKKTTLMAIVPTDDFWVDANFKETQLKNLYIGQTAKLTSDMYGKDIVFHGTVKAISSGTGAVFSLIPAQNATGNWIKIIQRVPVRISLDKKELQEHPLQLGNSMTVKIDIHDTHGKKINNQANSQNNNYEQFFYKNAIDEANKIAQDIIGQNL